MRKWLWAVLLVTLALAVAACGDDDDDDGGGDGQQAPSGDTSQASGNVAWCIGKDTSGAYGTAIDLFKKENPNVTVNLVELPESADEQRTQLVQRLDAESDECDVLGMDTIWTAEFAAQDWLQDTSDIIEPRQDDFIPSTLETAQYEDKYWAVPYHTNAGFLYYRTDQVEQAPESWEDVYSEGRKGNGVVYQGAQYEGLTVNFLELLYSGGGAVLSEDGTEVRSNSPEGEAALEFMAQGVQERRRAEGRHDLHGGGVAPRLRERQRHVHAQLAVRVRARQGVEDRRPVRHRAPSRASRAARRPACWAASTSPSRPTRRTRRARPRSSTSPPARRSRRRTSWTRRRRPPPPPRTTTRRSRRSTPSRPTSRRPSSRARSRPVSPVYSQINEAIYTNVHDALQGNAEPQAALEKMESDIQKALETF